LAFKNYGRLREHMAKALAEGKTKAEIAEDLGVTAARVNELTHCLQIPEICIDGEGHDGREA
jgi:DNA-directed RNA polymerase sigma subunit (sigma70/sigma32)